MAAVDNSTEVSTSQLIKAQTSEEVRLALNSIFWDWFDKNQNKSFKTKIGFIPISITVAKARPLFEMVFGPHP